MGTAEHPNSLFCVKTSVQPKREGRKRRGRICSHPSTRGMCENRDLGARDADFQAESLLQARNPQFYSLRELLIRAWSSREAVHEIQIWSAQRDCPKHI